MERATHFRLGRYRKPLQWALWLAVLIGVAGWQAEVDLGQLARNVDRGAQQLDRHFPPDLTNIEDMLMGALVTIGMALAATPLGAAVALAFGLAGAKNIAPAPLRAVSRFLISMERATPDIVVLLFFVAAFGLSYFSGVMALAIGCVGMLGRLLGDAIEEIDARVIESVEMVGASRWQVIRYAALPEAMPAFISNAIFRFEMNIRNATLLGAVGVGGIGYELDKAMQLMDYNEATTAILIIAAMALASEKTSDWLRKRVAAQGALLK